MWEKDSIVANLDKDKYRKDQCGAWIQRDKYGNRNSTLDWEIDHINPKGGDGLSNPRPLQWKNNVTTGEGRLKCPLTAEGYSNVEKK